MGRGEGDDRGDGVGRYAYHDLVFIFPLLYLDSLILVFHRK